MIEKHFFNITVSGPAFWLSFMTTQERMRKITEFALGQAEEANAEFEAAVKEKRSLEGPRPSKEK